IVDKLIEISNMDIPDPMVDAQVEGLVADYGRRMESQGITLDQYFQITGMSRADLSNQFKPQALKQIKTRLVLEEVAKRENIQISEDEINAEIKKVADNYKMDVEKVKGLFGEHERKQMSDDLAVQKAIDFLVENAKLV
ncbi:MAG: trigger factor, partial [Lachnoanaerobaculum saburreum]